MRENPNPNETPRSKQREENLTMERQRLLGLFSIKLFVFTTLGKQDVLTMKRDRGWKIMF